MTEVLRALLMIDIKNIMGLPTPNDMTVGVMRKAYYNSLAWQAVLGYYPSARVNVLWDDGTPVSDDMTIGELGRLVKLGHVHISIDDGSGQLEEA